MSNSPAEEQPSRRNELKKLHFQKAQELKKAKSRAEKERIEAKYKDLGERDSEPSPHAFSPIVLPESLYREEHEVSRAQMKKVARKAKEEAKRKEIVASVGDGSLELELAQNESLCIKEKIPAGFEIIQIAADGDCMFASLQAHLGESISCKELRELIADFLSSHEDEFRFFVDREDFQEYCEEVRTTAWGSDIELEALSRLLERSIIVLTAERIITVGEQFSEQTEPLRISFHLHQYSSPHYNAVMRSAA
jgi:hypothetical protein